MARGLYDYCRPPGGNPVFFSREVLMESGRQLQHPLLCIDCEGSLNRNGEAWLLPKLATIEGRFPFFDILQKVQPDAVVGDTKMYAASRNPEIDTGKLVHFAAGVFWKASVHSWRGSETAPLIELGIYGEPVRRFLLGRSPFPQDMVLVIGVAPPPVRMITFDYPYRGSERAFHNFLFYVLGIQFTLFVGRTIPAESR